MKMLELLLFEEVNSLFGLQNDLLLILVSAERPALNSLLSLQHIVKCHGSTLLPQFLGMYRVSVDNEETYLIVMRNMFSHRLVVHRKYDLKVRRDTPTNVVHTAGPQGNTKAWIHS